MLPFIPPALSEDEAVTRHTLLNPEDVQFFEPRLAHVDELVCRSLIQVSGEAWFISWPDGAVGFALLKPEAEIAERLIEAYAAARASLERLVLEHITSDSQAVAH